MGWMRYPGRLAHITEQAYPIAASDGRRVGTRWRTSCGRVDLRLWFDNRPGPSAIHVDVLELRLEAPRGWCLRCHYYVALDALVVGERDFNKFAAAVQSRGVPTIGAAA